MIRDATGNCFWKYDLDDEYRMTFLKQDPGEEEEALMTFRTYEYGKFLSVAVLVGERQHLWADWRAIAEESGGNVLSGHLISYNKTDYFPNFEDVTIKESSGGVIVSVHMLPTRRVDLIKHVFANPELHRAFLNWAEEAGQDRRIGLSLIGLLEGKKALAKMMDTIAERGLGFGYRVMAAITAAMAEGRDYAFLPPEEGPSLAEAAAAHRQARSHGPVRGKGAGRAGGASRHRSGRRNKE